MRLYSILLSSMVFTFFSACSQAPKKVNSQKNEVQNILDTFNLNDFLTENKALDLSVENIFKQMDDTAIVAQLIMPAVGKYGKSRETIEQHIKERIIGGVLMLNGTKLEFKEMISSFEKTNQLKGNLPFLYSADAEPSLVNRKIIGSTTVKKAAEIGSIEEVNDVAKLISNDLLEIGINYNFAPVVDVAGNATVGYRGFGSKAANLIPWSNAFIQETQRNNIIATAKHFPGHGLVNGDTHASLQSINGELKEVSNYPELIKQGLLSIMIAHIAVVNNKQYETKGLPATCSKKIVNDLLKKELNFKGLIVTDAMNMGGVINVPKSATKAIDAGCHIVLMPVDAKKTHQELLEEYRNSKDFKDKVNEAAKHVIRMKICLGLIK